MKFAVAAIAVATVVHTGADARAADVAELEILGFSAGGKVFAFEEFGVQDGSGFPYSTRFYIDVDTDRYLPGTPIRVRLEDDGTLEDARAESRAAGRKIVPDEELAANRGFTAASNLLTEIDGDPFRIVALPRNIMPSPDEPFEVRLEEVPLAQPAHCDAEWGIVVGYRLLRIDASPGGKTMVLHEDGSIPRSRGCPTGYRLGALQTLYPEGGEPAFAVLIQMRSPGFEGSDYNWLAVAGRL